MQETGEDGRRLGHRRSLKAWRGETREREREKQEEEEERTMLFVSREKKEKLSCVKPNPRSELQSDYRLCGEVAIKLQELLCLTLVRVQTSPERVPGTPLARTRESDTDTRRGGGGEGSQEKLMM